MSRLAVIQWPAVVLIKGGQLRESAVLSGLEQFTSVVLTTDVIAVWRANMDAYQFSAGARLVLDVRSILCWACAQNEIEPEDLSLEGFAKLFGVYLAPNPSPMQRAEAVARLLTII